MSKLGSLLIAAALIACGSSGDGPRDPNDGFDRRALLSNVGNNLIMPVYDNFYGSSVELAQAIEAHCESLGSADEATALDAARHSWREAMGAWQLAESMLFGPAEMNALTLRNQIYSWPLRSPCAVDQEVKLYMDAPDGYDISGKLNNRRGLDALEYLLFAPSLDHSCESSQTAPIGWNELDDATRKATRCEFAQLAAIDVQASAAIINEAWSPSAGNYIGDLANAGTSESSFRTAQEAINVVSDALFYLDSEVKTMKVGEPAGISINECGVAEEPCLAELESPLAGFSGKNVQINLEGFALLYRGDSFSGAAGLGFDDFLIHLGASDVASSFDTAIAGATTAVVALADFDAALTNDYEGVITAHTALKDVTVLLKGQFLTVLGLDLPDSAAGDND